MSCWTVRDRTTRRCSGLRQSSPTEKAPKPRITPSARQNRRRPRRCLIGSRAKFMSDNLRGALAMSISMAAFALEDALLKFAMQTVPTSIVLMLFGAVRTVPVCTLVTSNWRANPAPCHCVRSYVDPVGLRAWWAIVLLSCARLYATVQHHGHSAIRPLGRDARSGCVPWRPRWAAQVDCDGHWFCRGADDPAPDTGEF